MATHAFNAAPAGNGLIAAGTTDTNPFSALLHSWNRFWFAPGDPVKLGLIRICCGLITLYVHLAYSFDLYELFGKDAWLDLAAITEFRKEVPVLVPPPGWEQPVSPPLPSDPVERAKIEKYAASWNVDPRLAYAKGTDVWSIWYHVTDPRWMVVIHVAILGFMVLFTIGFCTRITAVLTWMGALCYIQRAPTTLFGMDTIMAVLLLYLMIGPSGAALSVDRLLARWWACRQAARNKREPGLWLPPQPSVSANFALRLMQIHFCIIYLGSGTSKLLGSSWWGGTAVWWTMVNYEFAPLNWQAYENFLIFVSQYRWLWEIITTGGVAFTLALEIGFPMLVWNRHLRWVMIASAALLHVGIAVTMGLTTFGLMMLTLLLSFVPATTVHQLVDAVTIPGKRWLAPANGLQPASAAA
jgi:hypothetical protein